MEEGRFNNSVLITLNRPELEFILVKVGYLCRSGHEEHCLWVVFSTARA